VIIAMEVVTAFFLEAGFLGLLVSEGVGDGDPKAPEAPVTVR